MRTYYPPLIITWVVVVDRSYMTRKLTEKTTAASSIELGYRFQPLVAS